MSTTTIDPPVQTETPPPEPRRHFGRWIATGVVLAVVSTAIAAGSYADSYQPLVVRGAMLYTSNGPKGSISVGTGMPWTIRYVEGASQLWGLDVQNDGRFPVTVTGAQWNGPPGPFGKVMLLLPTQAADQGSAAMGILRGLEPIHPFTLAPGEKRMIVLRFTMSGCTVANSGVQQGSVNFSANGLDIYSRSFGITHVIPIPVGTDGVAQIAVPDNLACI